MIKYFSVLLLTTSCLTNLDPNYETCYDFVSIQKREPGRVTYTVPVVDFDTQLSAPIPVPGAALTVCLNTICDIQLPLCGTKQNTCYRELPAPNPALRVLEFPYGLTNVTLRWTAPGYVPTDYPLGGPLVGSPSGSLEVRGIGIVLVRETTYVALHAQVGVAPDPTRGTLALRILDCSLQRSAGQELLPYNANLQGSTGFSLSTSNLATDAQIVTDERGVAGFFNLLPQTTDMSAHGIDTTTFNVSPGTLTLAELRWGLEEFGQ